MSKNPELVSRLVRVSAVSLVALVAGALANDAQASRLATAPNLGEGKLPARVAAIVEHIRAAEPTFLSQLPSAPKMAWRN
jgi:hypothetical protein